MRRGLHGIKEINRSQSVIIVFFSWGSDRPDYTTGQDVETVYHNNYANKQDGAPASSITSDSITALPH